MKKRLLTAAIFALAGLHQPAFAHGHEKQGDQPHETVSTVATPALTVQATLATIQAGMATIGSQIEAGQFDTIHEEIEKIDLSVKMLKENATVSDDKKARLESSINQFTGQLSKLHTVADAKNAEKSKVEFKKAQGALKLVESSLK